MASIPSVADKTEIAGVSIPSATSNAVPNKSIITKVYLVPFVAFLTW